jgi:hypothetical protein
MRTSPLSRLVPLADFCTASSPEPVVVHHGKMARRCPRRINRSRSTRPRRAPNVRFTSNSGQTLAPQRNAALCQERTSASLTRSPRRRRAASMARRGRGPVSCPCPVQRLAAALRLPGHLAALAAWAVIVAHHTTLAPMGQTDQYFCCSRRSERFRNCGCHLIQHARATFAAVKP